MSIAMPVSCSIDWAKPGRSRHGPLSPNAAARQLIHEAMRHSPRRRLRCLLHVWEGLEPAGTCFAMPRASQACTTDKPMQRRFMIDLRARGDDVIGTETVHAMAMTLDALGRRFG